MTIRFVKAYFWVVVILIGIQTTLACWRVGTFLAQVVVAAFGVVALLALWWVVRKFPLPPAPRDGRDG
jgi:hypothetical protein